MHDTLYYILYFLNILKQYFRIIVVNCSHIIFVCYLGPNDMVVIDGLPSCLEVLERQDIQLTFTINQQVTSSHVQWYKDTQILQASDYVKFLNDGSRFSLIVTNCTLTDGGHYFCKVKNKAIGPTKVSIDGKSLIQ